MIAGRAPLSRLPDGAVLFARHATPALNRLAENFLVIATVAPVARAGARFIMTELPWNSGIAR
jgi:hypothetical protein